MPICAKLYRKMVPETQEEITFLDALYAKYFDDGSLEEVVLPQKHGRQRVCEFVGFDKVREDLKQITNLIHINLSNLGINSLDRSIDETFQLKKAKTIDLSMNQLRDWTTIAQIVQLTTSLDELILSHNPLNVPTDEEIAKIGSSLSNLKTIVLGNMSYDWFDLLRCAQLWPNITKLSLFENNIVQLKLSDILLQNLRFLSLSSNLISNWKEVNELGKLKRLETLELPNCKISSICFGETKDYTTPTDLFPNLVYLDLTNNQISDWRSVAQLNKLPNLTTLLLKKNPLYNQNEYYYNFNFVISRIKRLEKLDREPITKESRNDGEKYYLRTIFLEYLQKTTDTLKKQFLEENPCFLELLDKLGEPVVARKLTKDEEIKENYIILNVIDEQNPDESKRKIKKQVPKRIKVSNLKFILRRLLKIDMSIELKLIITSSSYCEEMQDACDINVYRLDAASTISVQRV